MTRINFHASLAGLMMATLSLYGCDKSPSGATNSPPPTPAKTSNASTPQQGKVADATSAATGAIAGGQQAVAGALQDLGVTLPSFEELRAKAGQTINAQNADAEFEQLQLEVESEGGPAPAPGN